MKKSLTIIMLLLAHITFAQLASKQVETTIKDVTVYKQGAQVTRQTELKLKKGDNEFSLTGLSSELDPTTIQVKDIGSCTILSVSHNLDYSKEDSRKTEISKIKILVDTNKTAMNKLLAEYQVYSEEETLLEGYTIPNTSDKQAVSLASMKETLDFYRARLLEIKKKKIALEASMKKLETAKSEMGAQLDSLLAIDYKPTSLINLKVSAKKDTTLTLQFSYYVTSAGWNAIYDVRVTSVAEPITLISKANVYQETGEDWNSVALTLTSSNPVSLNESPTLSTWSVSRYSSSSPLPTYYSLGTFSPTGTCIIKGKVTDKTTQEPLPFAAVTLSYNGKIITSTFTDMDGYYSLKTADAGKYDVKVAFVGYNSTLLSGVDMNVNRIASGNVELESSKITMNEVEIVSEKSTTTGWDYEGSGTVANMQQEQYSPVSGGVNGKIDYNDYRGNVTTKGSRSLSDISVATDGDTKSYSNSQLIDEKNIVPNKTAFSPTSFQYTIDVPYTVPADGKDYSVQIKEFSVPAIYEYSTIPKADKNAFLMANIVDWDQFNLMKGKTNLYYEGTYIGTSYLNVGSVDDTLKVSLGNDQSINIKRERLKEVRSKKFLSSSVKETFGWEISVRNNKKEKITINIMDQFPVSADKEIEVELLESSGAVVDNDKGELKWKVDINPGETKKYTIKYSVKYPSSYQMDLE